MYLKAMKGIFLSITLLCFFGSIFAQDTVNPEEVTSFLISKSGDDLILSWEAVTTDILGNSESISHYNIYKSSSTPFIPDRTNHSNLRGKANMPLFNLQQAALPFESDQMVFYLVTAVDLEDNEGAFGTDVAGDPEFIVAEPQDGSSFIGDEILVKGTVNDKNAEVFINGIRALVGIDMEGEAGGAGTQQASANPFWVIVPTPTVGLNTLTTQAYDQYQNMAEDVRTATKESSDCSGKPDGFPCDDGISCSSPDTCFSGVCQAGPPQQILCNSDDFFDTDCLLNVCDQELGCVPLGGNEPKGWHCCVGVDQSGYCLDSEDSYPCTAEFQCDGLGNCGNNNHYMCGNSDDSDADCRRNNCIGFGGDENGCEEAYEPSYVRGNCEDGFICSTADWCQDGVCIPNASWFDDELCPDNSTTDSDADCLRDDCNPFDPSADPVTGCVDDGRFEPGYHYNNCDDGISCSFNDYCYQGECQTNANSLDNEICPENSTTDSDADCKRDSCNPFDPSADPVTGCVVDGMDEPSYFRGMCDDGYACTIRHICELGVCSSGVARDSLCGDVQDDCTHNACIPSDPGADSDGCVSDCLDSGAECGVDGTGSCQDCECTY